MTYPNTIKEINFDRFWLKARGRQPRAHREQGLFEIMFCRVENHRPISWDQNSSPLAWIRDNGI
jgi:hypothetical protein